MGKLYRNSSDCGRVSSIISVRAGSYTMELCPNQESDTINYG
jgi:hypothetical protein